MGIEHYIAACLTVIVLAIVVATVFLALALWQLRRAAQSLEILSSQVGHQVGRLEGLTGALLNTATLASGGVGRGAAIGASLLWGAINFFKRRRSERGPSAGFNREDPR